MSDQVWVMISEPGFHIRQKMRNGNQKGIRIRIAYHPGAIIFTGVTLHSATIEVDGRLLEGSISGRKGQEGIVVAANRPWTKALRPNDNKRQRSRRIVGKDKARVSRQTAGSHIVKAPRHDRA